MAVAERVLRAEHILDLRALYDAAHEARAQRSVRIESISTSEAIDLAGLPERRVAEAFGVPVLEDKIFWADLHSDAVLIDDSQAIRTTLLGSFAEFSDQLAAMNPQKSARVAREILRRTNLVLARTRRERTAWPLHEITLKIARDATPDDLTTHASLTRVDAVNRLRYVEIYEGILVANGLRPRAPMTTDEFANTCFSMLEGLHMSAAADTELTRPTGFDGEEQVWSISGIMFEALVLSSVEADPFADFAIDLSVWR